MVLRFVIWPGFFRRCNRNYAIFLILLSICGVSISSNHYYIKTLSGYVLEHSQDSLCFKEKIRKPVFLFDSIKVQLDSVLNAGSLSIERARVKFCAKLFEFSRVVTGDHCAIRERERRGKPTPDRIV